MSDNLARVMRPAWHERASAENQQEQPGTEESPKRHIRIVPSRSQRQARPKIAYALTALCGMAVIVAAQLLLSVGISQSAYEISTLQGKQVELGRTAESVGEDLVRASSPQSLAANAAALGMVANSNPVYLRLSDGAVLGAPQQAEGTPAGGETLVPNSLLAGSVLVTEVPPAGAQGTGVPAAPGAAAPVSSPVKPVEVQASSGIPSPATR